MEAMTMQESGRGPLVMLGSLAALLALAGVLPWLAGGSGAAKAFGTPLLLMGLFAGYAVFRAGRSGPAAWTRQPARARPAGGTGAPAGVSGCGGCVCGAGGCQGAPRVTR
jgi:hypothetical protein